MNFLTPTILGSVHPVYSLCLCNLQREPTHHVEFTLLPPLESMSPNGHGAAIVVTGYLLIVITILVITIQIATTYALKGRPGLNHEFLGLALVG